MAESDTCHRECYKESEKKVVASMSDNREYIIGVDIAKIIAMVFVVGVHVAGDGFEWV